MKSSVDVDSFKFKREVGCAAKLARHRYHAARVVLQFFTGKGHMTNVLGFVARESHTPKCSPFSGNTVLSTPSDLCQHGSARLTPVDCHGDTLCATLAGCYWLGKEHKTLEVGPPPATLAESYSH